MSVAAAGPDHRLTSQNAQPERPAAGESPGGSQGPPPGDARPGAEGHGQQGAGSPEGQGQGAGEPHNVEAPTGRRAHGHESPGPGAREPGSTESRAQQGSGAPQATGQDEPQGLRRRAPEARERRVRTNRGARTPRPTRTPGHGNNRVRRAATTGRGSHEGQSAEPAARRGASSRDRQHAGGSSQVAPASAVPGATATGSVPVSGSASLASSVPTPAPRRRLRALASSTPALRARQLRAPRRLHRPGLAKYDGVGANPPAQARGHRDRPPRFAHTAARGALPTRTVVQCGGSTGVSGPSRSEPPLPWRRSGSRPRARRRSRTGGERSGAPRGTVAPRHSSARSRGSSTWSPRRCGS